MPMRSLDEPEVPPASGPLHARHVEILGVRIANLHTIEAVAHMQKLIWASAPHARAVYIVNAHTLNLACEDPEYRAVLNAADTVFGDGTGVRWAARWQGKKMIDNLVGTDLLPFFFMNTLERDYRYFLVGAKADVVARAAEHLTSRLPGLNVVGHQHGHYPASEHDDVLARINAARPDVLMVGMGNPIQERWIHDNRTPAHGREARRRRRRALRSLGRRAHARARWVRRNGFEWVQLMLQQPHKWRRYLIGNPKFLLRVAQEIQARQRLTGVERHEGRRDRQPAAGHATGVAGTSRCSA